MAAFSANPLSLALPQQAFESWLQENGHLQTLDSQNSFPSSSSPSSSENNSFFSLSSLVSFLAINPFAKLTNNDLSGPPAPWTSEFLHSGAGPRESYSLPASTDQARLRMQDNVRRYARNYLYVTIVIIGCSLYQIPIALIGILATFAVWDMFRLGSIQLGLERRPVVQQIFLLIAQSVTALILIYCRVMIAFLWAVAISYAVLIAHSSLRKLPPSKQTPTAEQRMRIMKNN